MPRLVSFGLTALRAVSALVALLGITAAAAWHWWPEPVHRLDRWLEARARGNLAETLEAARQRAAADPDRARDLLEGVRARTAAAARGDHGFDLHRSATLAMAALLRESGDLVAAAEVLEELVEKNRRDLVVRTRLGRIMLGIAHRRAEAIDDLLELQRELPEEDRLAHLLLPVLREEGRWAQAADVLARWLAAPRHGTCFLSYMQPDKETPRYAVDWARPHWSASGEWTFAASLEGPISAVRFDLPQRRHLRVRPEALHIAPATGGSRDIHLAPGTFAPAGLTRDGNVWTTSGSPRPGLLIPIDPPTPAGPATFTFRLQANPQLPPLAKRLLSGSDAARLGAALPAEAEPRLHSALHRGRALATFVDALVLGETPASEVRFGPPTPDRNGTFLPFVATWDAPSPTGPWTITLPLLPGAVVILDEVATDDGAPLEFEIQGAERVGTALHITAPDPSLTLRRSAPTAPLTLRGRCR